MATLAMWKFDTPSGAARLRGKLQELSGQGLVVVHDAASRVLGAGRREAEDPPARRGHRAGRSAARSGGCSSA